MAAPPLLVPQANPGAGYRALRNEIDAAVDGQGVALARTALAAWDLINGRLVRPIDVSLRLSNTYWIVCPKATSALPKIKMFREWLLTQAADDMRRLETRH